MLALGSPPLNVRASQASLYDPVEVSWSPPSDGATIITGYRIFYGSGENTSVTSVVRGVSLTPKNANASYIGQDISVCTEVEQLDITMPSIIGAQLYLFLCNYTIYVFNFQMMSGNLVAPP